MRTLKELNLDVAQRYCVFQSAENWFGFPCLNIRSVIPRPAINRMPFSDPVLQGVSHIQNEFVPVFSLRSLLNVQYESLDGEQQLMILPGPQSPWGLLIDRTIGLAELETSYSALSQLEDSGWSKVVVGSASYGSHVLRVLDPEAIYRYAQDLLESYWHDATEFTVEPETTGSEP